MPEGLSGGALLAAREQGARLHPVDRALLLLRLADPDETGDAAALPIAERDRRLFAHRRATFGDDIACIVDCRACGARQEFALSAAMMMRAAGEGSPSPETLALDGWEVSLRALDSRDLAAAARARDADAAADLLLARAMTVRGPGETLPAGLCEAAAARVAEREAAADVALDLVCADCGAGWTAPFDIAAHFWSEVDIAGRRLLGEVATLAARFGWSEAAILAMSPARRAAYLDTIHLQAGGHA